MRSTKNHLHNPYLLRANQEQYKAIIRQMDLQEVEMTNDKNAKVIVRKSQRKADTFITWAVFRRDNYTCRYCGRNDVPLTYDHVKLWKDQGEWSMENGVTACRKCNKTRGDMDFELWLNTDYVQKLLPNVPEELIQMNVETMKNYKNFPNRTSKRSR